ncbi:MAG: DUF2007 domain-containing protein [Chloroflexota bacterium]
MKKNLDAQEPDWTVVYMTPHYSEAHMIAGKLQSAGIEPYVHSQPGASALGITLGVMGNISVLVRPSDYDQAMHLIFPDEPDELPHTTEDFYIIDPDDESDPDSD